MHKQICTQMYTCASDMHITRIYHSTHTYHSSHTGIKRQRLNIITSLYC